MITWGEAMDRVAECSCPAVVSPGAVMLVRHPTPPQLSRTRAEVAAVSKGGRGHRKMQTSRDPKRLTILFYTANSLRTGPSCGT